MQILFPDPVAIRTNTSWPRSKAKMASACPGFSAPNPKWVWRVNCTAVMLHIRGYYSSTKSGKDHLTCTRSPAQRLYIGVNPLQMHGFPVQILWEILWGISLIQRRESTISAIKFVLIHSACFTRVIYWGYGLTLECMYYVHVYVYWVYAHFRIICTCNYLYWYLCLCSCVVGMYECTQLRIVYR